MSYDLLVTIWGALMAASPLLQAAKALRTGSSEDVSIPMLVILMIGGVLWLGYGLRHDLIAIIICNGIGTMCCLATILAVQRTKRRALIAEGPAFPG